jgi:TolB-like protein
LSGDKQQEYFSDGLTEELLNSLSRINELHVTGRTSSFFFKGEHVDLSTVAHKLNVASVLEGSVRRSARTVRISAQLIDAVTGFHLWSQTYDRDLRDVLKLQSDIADSVASSLRVTLLEGLAAKIELGGTRDPAEFDPGLSRASMPARRNSAGVAVPPSMDSPAFMVLCDLSAARIHQRCERAGRLAERVGVLGVRSIV